MTYIQKGGLFGEWQPGLGYALTYSAPQWLLKHSACNALVTDLPFVKYLHCGLNTAKWSKDQYVHKHAYL